MTYDLKNNNFYNKNMTSPSWSPDEDHFLVQQCIENQCSFDSIAHLFPERDKYAIIKRFKKLEQNAKEKGIPIIQLVSENAESNIIETIKLIFLTHNKKSRILERLLLLSCDPSDIITALLLLAKDNDLL